MRLSACGAENVLDIHAAGEERVGDQRAVATPGNGFGAHDGGGLLGGDFYERFDSGGEFGSLHVIGKSAEAGIFPSGINAVARGVAQAPEVFHRSVINPRSVKRFGEFVGVELRIVARARNGADIHHALDAVGFQKPEELLDGMVRVPDCEYWKRTALRRGAFLVGSLLFGVLCHPMYISGAIRACCRV